MKIGITCYPTYGGSGVVATELGIELAARGHEVHFITYSQPFRLTGRETNIRYHEVPVSNYPLFEYPPYDLALATRMAEVAEFYSLDLLHVHYAIPHSISALLARQMLAARGRHLPFITTLHGTDITLVGLDRAYLPITRFGIDQSDGVTAISAYLADQTRENLGITREIEVIRNFVNCDFYQRDPALVAAQRPRYARPGERLLVHLSNFRPVKRVTDVIEVFSRVAAVMPARLLLIGDGPERSAAEFLATRLGVADRVDFLGKQENVNELLALADLMVMPSGMESFGLAALEGMACRVPAIATRVGGVPELVEHDVNGLLYEVGDVEAMAAGAIDLLSDPARLEAMSTAARRTARTASAPAASSRSTSATTSRCWIARRIRGLRPRSDPIDPEDTRPANPSHRRRPSPYLLSRCIYAHPETNDEDLNHALAHRCRHPLRPRARPDQRHLAPRAPQRHTAARAS